MSDLQLQRAGELVRQGQLAQAEAILRRLASRPGAGAGVLVALAQVLGRRGSVEQARHFAREAAGRGTTPEEACAAGRALEALGDVEGALGAFGRGVELSPSDGASLNGLGLVLLGRDDVEGAIGRFRQGAEAAPDQPAIRANLAWAMSLGWRLDEAMAEVGEAVSRWPGEVEPLRLRAFLSNYADVGAGEAFAAQAALGRAIEALGAPLRTALGPPGPARAEGVLRVGLLSPDLREHPVSCFVEGLLAGRDASRLGLACYSLSPHQDATTRRLRDLADGWLDLSGLDDLSAARAIRADGPDVLLDLAGHTGGARPTLLAARAVGVQGCYLGYPASSGMESVGLRLVDSTTDPAGGEGQTTERLVRLDPCFLAYTPKPAARVVPARGPGAPGAGGVTFGSFGTLRKLTPAWLEVWARIVRSVPGSRLVLKNSGLGDAATRARVLGALARAGVEGVEVLAPSPDFQGAGEHFRAYHQVDIALDTHPYNGTTTTCDALWMGVPVVAMRGDRHVSRVSASLLGACGAGELVADDPDEFVRLAVDLARDPQRRGRYHAQLRRALERGPLGDGAGLAARLEGALRAHLAPGG